MIQIEYLPLVLTGIGIIASILYYTMVLRNANKTQQLHFENRQAQLLMSLYDKYTETELMRQQIEIISQAWSDVDDFWDRYGPFSNPDFYTQFARLAYYFDGIGVLIKRDLVDKNAIYDLMGVHILQYWSDPYGKLIEGLREKWNNPHAYKWFEYLAKEMEKLKT